MQGLAVDQNAVEVEDHSLKCRTHPDRVRGQAADVRRNLGVGVGGCRRKMGLRRVMVCVGSIEDGVPVEYRSLSGLPSSTSAGP